MSECRSTASKDRKNKPRIRQARKVRICWRGSDLLESFGRRAEELGFAIRRIDIWKDPRWKDESRAEHINSQTDTHCNPRACYLHAVTIRDSMVEGGLIAGSKNTPGFRDFRR